MPCQQRYPIQDWESGTDQNITPLVFKVPLLTVDDHALVYGERTASGIAGGLTGEYEGRGCPLASLALV